MNHLNPNNGKEYLRKEHKVRQYRSNQGRSPEQMENSYKALEWTFMLGAIVAIVYIVLGVFNWL